MTRAVHPANVQPPVQRCAWASSELLIAYHDQEWGVPVHDDRALFEFLTLEGAQAGLSWETVLRKRDEYRRLFDGFDPSLVAGYGQEKMESLLMEPGIIRNRLKVGSAVGNARCFLEVQREFGSFDAYLWGFVEGVPLGDAAPATERVTRNAVSDHLSKDLARRGFKFVGTTICYALMQAVGMVNDHESGCFRREEVARRRRVGR